ncbi:MAG: DNA polymerase I [Gammaproteobacteria bacterium]|nr:DNA polymerase I [Gammaproteobacteria bacterium]MYC51573.1 DNA polymerase I [Gammaproteobacteria bacterium]
MNPPTLFLIDAYALIYQSFFAFANRPLTNSRGENTSAEWGFLNYLIRIREEFAPAYLAVVFDAGSSQRKELYPEYKATREKMPEDLRESLGRIRSLLDALHHPVVEVEGFEADDVIASLALRALALEEDIEAVIVSGDKDFYQLLRPGLRLFRPARGGRAGTSAEWVDESNASKRFGVPPDRIIDYLALIGDSSDNVPGAPGIGPKTAVKLIEQYGDLDQILAHAEEVRAKRPRESLLNNADQIRLSRQLVTMLTDVEVNLDLDGLAVRAPDRERMRELLLELEFHTLLERFSGAAADDVSSRDEDVDYRLVLDEAGVDEVVGEARAEGEVAVAVLTASPDPMRGSIAGIALSSQPGKARYLPLAHQPALDLEMGALAESAASASNLPALDSPAMAPLRDLLEDTGVPKTGHDLKHGMVALAEAGIALGGGSFDTMVASYLLEPELRGHELETLAANRLELETIRLKELVGTGKKEVPLTRLAPEKVLRYACERADCAGRLREHFRPRLEGHALDGLFRNVEMRLVPVLARMERNGVRIDPLFFSEMSRQLEHELGLVQEEIFREAGSEFNLNSTPQLRTVLFEDLGLPVIRKTKTGPSTAASVLEELEALGHPVPRLLMQYRRMEKLRSTYIDALPGLVHPRTGRIHTHFNQTVAATGRLSSSNPNLQNIPIRTRIGREIRKGFVAAPGHVLLTADYSQIELRILAHFSGDPAFVTAFREASDIHRQTAAVIFDVPVDEVSPRMRDQAKTINFATLYGQGAFSLGRQLGIPQGDAKRFIDQYFERFSGVRTFLDEQVSLAKERGYVETLAGRRRYVPELASRNWNIRAHGERIARNTPIQGTAADVIKKAMIEVQQALDKAGSAAMMLLQVHDELVLETPAGELEAVRDMVVSHMENATALEVPLVVDTGAGESWFECKG